MVYGGGWRDAGRFAEALNRAGYAGPKIATQAAHDPRFLAEAGEDAAGWLLVSTAADPASVPSVHAFAAAYRKRYDGARRCSPPKRTTRSASSPPAPRSWAGRH